MKFSTITPILYTTEIRATIDFYASVLGFTCGEYDEEWQWATLRRDACEIMLSKPNGHTPFDKPNFTGSFYIKIDDVETFWNQVKDKAKVCYELETFDWDMREFAVYDNNGYVLQFGQEG